MEVSFYQAKMTNFEKAVHLIKKNTWIYNNVSYILRSLNTFNIQSFDLSDIYCILEVGWNQSVVVIRKIKGYNSLTKLDFEYHRDLDNNLFML